MKLKQIHNIFVLISSLFYFFSSLRRGDQSTVFAQYLLILTDPGLLRSGTRLHWFVAVVLLILEDLFAKVKYSIIKISSKITVSLSFVQKI